MQIENNTGIRELTEDRPSEIHIDTRTESFVVIFALDGSIQMANPPANRFLANMIGNKTEHDAFNTQQVLSVIGYKSHELNSLLADIQLGRITENSKRVILTERNNERCYLERQESVLKDSNGNISGLMVMICDITSQVEREKWRNDFTNMVVHDLKNPVSTLYTSFEWMAPIIQNPETAKLVESGQRVSRQLLDMIDSLLDIARIEAGRLSADLEKLDISLIAQREIDTLLHLANLKNIALTLNIDPRLGIVWGDHSMVRRILSNLIDNALKFTPSNGKVLVDVRLTQPDDKLTGGSKITISDTGSGILPADRDRIFNHFEMVGGRGKHRRGAGIGLSFCKQAIEAMGGRIWIEGNPDGGSRFVFVLPGVSTIDKALPEENTV
ncbi:MAG: signal transduction histidine kinase [Cellvibrionaceae bacterium]|jgi:signal transduction histidine kinase